MTPVRRVEIGGLEYLEVLFSWVATGDPHNPQSGVPRRYCTLAAVVADGGTHGCESDGE